MNRYLGRVKRDLVSLGVAFLIGFVGWLLIGELQLENEWLMIAALAAGSLAATVSRWPRGLAALVAGVAASYPAALIFGTIAFLGENVAIYVIFFVTLAAVGFGGARFVLGRLLSGDIRAR